MFHRSTRVVSVVAALLLVGGPAGAQTIPGNENDLQLANGIDMLYVFSDPSVGPPVGASGVPDFNTNDYFWKVMSRDALRHCTGIMEVTGMEMAVFDGDYAQLDGSGNNTALPDCFISRGIGMAPIEPDQADPTGVLVTFGPGGPKNNVFITNPGCPPPGYVFGFLFDVSLTGGGGTGIPVAATGAEDLVLTIFCPGGDHTFSGFNLCGNLNGDGAIVDAHSSDATGAIGETQFDVLGGGIASNFGGFQFASGPFGPDGLHEIAQATLEFREPVLAMHVDSATGMGVEEGLAGVHYDCPPGPGGSIGARLYAWQGLGQPAAVMGTLAPPLGACLPFKGSRLGLNAADPLFNIFLGLWQGTVIQTDNGDPPTGTPLDDGTFTTIDLPLPGQVVGPGVTVPLSFQAFWKLGTGNVDSSQVTRLFLHG